MMQNFGIGWMVLMGVLMLGTSPHPARVLGSDGNQGATLRFQARTQVETAEGTGRFHSLPREVEWQARETAIVICDMWDRHWCPAATRRVGQMAPRMNDVVKRARQQGVLIIHCPSGTMDFYKDTPQRKLAQQAPPLETEIPLQDWCHLDQQRESDLPIDDSDGGCDTIPSPEQGRAWSRQIATIEIEEGDAITDSAEAYYLMRQRGIKNVIVMGVHTNMCVLGRPFSVRQMVYQGQNVLLMRDMTDTMYNPRMSPYVSHFTGTDLVVEHIERHWCPTITSADLLGGKPFRFANDKRPHLVIVMAEQEYRTNETLPKFALSQLGEDFRLSYVYADADNRNNLPGIEVLKAADVLLVSARRRVLPKEQLDAIREFIAAGKPVVGIRTANHAFSLRRKQPAEGLTAWESFDAEVIGGNYAGHHGNELHPQVGPASAAGDHPILAGVDIAELRGHGSLYRVAPLSPSATPLLIGKISGQPEEPVAWTNETKFGGRVFYTSLGHPGDFALPSFKRLLENGVHWAAGLQTKTSVPADDSAGRSDPGC